MSEVGVCNNTPTMAFSMAYTAVSSPRVRLRIDTSHAVSASVTYGGVAMTCTDKARHAAPTVEHHFEIHNPPRGTQMISGTFSADVLFVVRLLDDAWFDTPQSETTSM